MNKNIHHYERAYIPPEFQEEENRIMHIIATSYEELTAEELIEKYASKEYKEYLRECDKQAEELWKQGIIAN